MSKTKLISLNPEYDLTVQYFSQFFDIGKSPLSEYDILIVFGLDETNHLLLIDWKQKFNLSLIIMNDYYRDNYSQTYKVLLNNSYVYDTVPINCDKSTGSCGFYKSVGLWIPYYQFVGDSYVKTTKLLIVDDEEIGEGLLKKVLRAEFVFMTNFDYHMVIFCLCHGARVISGEASENERLNSYLVDYVYFEKDPEKLLCNLYLKKDFGDFKNNYYSKLCKMGIHGVAHTIEKVKGERRNEETIKLINFFSQKK